MNRTCKTYVVGGLSWDQLAGSVVQVEDAAHLYVAARMRVVSGDLAADTMARIGKPIETDIGDSAVVGAVSWLERTEMRKAEVQRAIDALLKSRELHLLEPDTLEPTLRIQGACIWFDQLAQLLARTEGVHLQADCHVGKVAAPEGEDQAEATVSAPDEVAAAIVVPMASRPHRIARDLLAPLLDRACRAVPDPLDSAAVMAELERLARLPEEDRPAPLAGVTSGGVKWLDGGRTKVLTRKALGDRLRRRAQAR